MDRLEQERIFGLFVDKVWAEMKETCPKFQNNLKWIVDKQQSISNTKMTNEDQLELKHRLDENHKIVNDRIKEILRKGDGGK